MEEPGAEEEEDYEEELDEDINGKKTRVGKSANSKAIKKTDSHISISVSSSMLTGNNSQSSMKKRQTHYLKIDDDMRRMIVFEVIVMKDSLKNVCDRYGINFSSAKNVIQIYKKEGRLEKKIVKARKIGGRPKGNDSDGDSDGGLEDIEDDEGDSYEEDGVRISTIAPEEQRCKLNLFIQPIEDA